MAFRKVFIRRGGGFARTFRLMAWSINWVFSTQRKLRRMRIKKLPPSFTVFLRVRGCFLERCGVWIGFHLED